MKVAHLLIIVVLTIVGAHSMAQHLQPMGFSRPIPSLLQMGQISEGTEESGETGSASESGTGESGTAGGSGETSEGSSGSSGSSGESSESSSKLFPGSSPGSSMSSSSSSSGSSEESSGSEESTMKAAYMSGSEASETSATGTVANVPQKGPGMENSGSPGAGGSSQSSLDVFPPISDQGSHSGSSSRSRFSESSESGEMSQSRHHKKYVMPEHHEKRLPETDVFGEAPHTDLNNDEVDIIARHVLKGARAARCARTDEYCRLKFKNCFTDKCRDEAASQSRLSPGERAEIRGLLHNF